MTSLLEKYGNLKSSDIDYDKILDEIDVSTDFLSAQSIARKLIDYHYDKMDKSQRAKSYRQLARSSFFLGNDLDSIKYSNMGLEMLDEDKTNYIASRLYNNLAGSYARRNNYSLSINAYGKALEAAVISEKVIFENVIINNIGNLYILISDFEYALISFWKCIELFESNPEHKKDSIFKDGNVITNINIAICLSNIFQYERAAKYIEKVKALFEKETPEVFYTYVLDAEIKICEGLGQYDKADSIFNDVYRRYKEDNNMIELSKSLLRYVEMLLERRKFDFKYIVKNLKAAENFSLKLKDNSTLSKIYLRFIDAYIRQKDNENIYKYYLKYLSHSEEVEKRYFKEQSSATKGQYEAIQIKSDKLLMDEARIKIEIERHRISEEKNVLESDYEMLRFINSVAAKIRVHDEFGKILQELKKSIMQKIRVDEVLIFSVNSASKTVTRYNIKKSSHIDINLEKDQKEKKNELESFTFAIDETENVITEIIREKRAFIFDEASKELAEQGFENKHCLKSEISYESVINLPLIINEKVIGVFSIYSFEKAAFTDREINLIKTLLPYISIAVYNFQKETILQEELANQLKLKSDLERINSKLVYISELDGLTNVPNKRYFDMKYHYINRLVSEDENSAIAVYMLDIDRFKNYNDSYGHLEGDKVLQKIAQRLNDEFNSRDSVFARFGGEEFVAVQKSNNFEKVCKHAEKLRKLVEDMKIENENTEHGIITISIGLVFCKPDSVGESDRIISAADRLLYKAKKLGRNKVISKHIKSLSKRKTDTDYLVPLERED